VHGHFSFNLRGLAEYVKYCTKPSAKKLQSDLDTTPYSWPACDYQTLVSFAVGHKTESQQKESSTKKRSLLTFSELTTTFVENNVRSKRDAWMLAKRQKVAGDDTLFNTLGATPCVEQLVAKTIIAWNPEGMSNGTLVLQPDFGLSSFLPLSSIDARIVTWVEKEARDKVLILSGRGGLGKTELCCAIMHEVTRPAGFHFCNELDRLRDVSFTPGQGLVVDEVYLRNSSVDSVKALLDLVKTRDIKCRNRDGCLPARTPRIFSTNWSWSQMWPREAFDPEHYNAIIRRIVWVDIWLDVRRLPAQPAPEQPSVSSPPLPLTGTDPALDDHAAVVQPFEDEDAFGYSHLGLDDGQ